MTHETLVLMWSMNQTRIIYQFRVFFALMIFSTPVAAEEMEFQGGGNDVRCRECAFIQATGEITTNTPAKFKLLLEKYPRDIYGALRIRLSSPGGDLRSAIELGQMFRDNGNATEIGSDKADLNSDMHSAFGDGRTSVRTAGECASACAYAFLGGIERKIANGSRMGVHRFYRMDVIKNPTLPLFTGQDLAEEQRITSALVLYAMQMGVSPEIVALASEAGPTEMRWVESDEARALKLSYSPREWQPWRIETYNGGVVATSETADKTIRMVASCTKSDGPSFALTDYSDDVAGTLAWFEQNRTCSNEGYHPILGAHVSPDNVVISKTLDGGARVEFMLRKQRLSLEHPSFFSRSETGFYPNACSTDLYDGSIENFKAAVNIAFRNCIERE
ncbi:MAG: hypothetical protein K8F25_02580 [Fimbriimonadaceae bacterium]|nr:hypothetical protein [Alphaproteobacteria bacterium]